jgi:hypothetical protein
MQAHLLVPPFDLFAIDAARNRRAIIQEAL